MTKYLGYSTHFCDERLKTYKQTALITSTPSIIPLNHTPPITLIIPITPIIPTTPITLTS